METEKKSEVKRKTNYGAWAVITLIVILAVLMFIGANRCSNSIDEADRFYSQFTEIGYNTWDYNRVYVFEVPYEIEMKDIEKHASELMYTDRHSTVAAYYFNFNSKNPVHASSFDEATTLAVVDGCYVLYWHYTDGKEEFIDKPVNRD